VPIPKTGKPKNKVEKVGVFLAAQNHHAKHHNNCAFHHKHTTISPPQNTTKSQNPQQKPPFSFPKYFLQKRIPRLTFPPSKPIGKRGTPHAASEVVLPNPAPQT
jgi:hypothetical protein